MKEEKEVEEGEISKAHQTPQGGTICMTGHTCTKGKEECETGSDIQAVQRTILSPVFRNLQVSEMLQELPKMLWRDRKQDSIKAHLEKENEAVSR